MTGYIADMIPASAALNPLAGGNSTAKNGTISTIVPTLNPGAVVSTKRTESMYIVTEYGVATMTGKSVRERAKELIAIAHPDFRTDLLRDAKK